jgi:hypothetical protein
MPLHLAELCRPGRSRSLTSAKGLGADGGNQAASRPAFLASIQLGRSKRFENHPFAQELPAIQLNYSAIDSGFRLSPQFRHPAFGQVAFGSNRNRHCERSEAIQGNVGRPRFLDCFVAALLAMTIPSERSTL